jgi:ABC-type spermidine/putrescine transport system permease subunit I
VATQILASQNLPLGAAMAVILIGLLALIVVLAASLLWSARQAFRVFRGAPL